MINLAINITRKQFASNGIVALRNLEFTISSGEFVALVGPSGAGKSTILNIIGGLDRDYDGDVLVNDQTLRDCSMHPARIGYVFQEPRLMPWLTVIQNVELVLDGERDRRSRALEMIDQVELNGRAESYPGQLSGGMQRRIALARAFAMRPNLLLMDEPFVSLDEPTAQRLRGHLLSLWQALRPTVVFVTHNLLEALTLADQVMFLSASPGKMIHRLAVDIKRPRNLQDPAISDLHKRVMRDHPEILSGLTTEIHETEHPSGQEWGAG